MVIYDMIPKANMRNRVKTTPEDHLIILSEFLTSNKAQKPQVALYKYE